MEAFEKVNVEQGGWSSGAHPGYMVAAGKSSIVDQYWEKVLSLLELLDI